MRIAAGAPWSQTIDLATARMTLVGALAWRAVAELMRRHHRRYAMRVVEVHPGVSVRGLLEVSLTPRQGDGRPTPSLQLNLGGPSGQWRVGDCTGNLADLLGPRPVAVIDAMVSALGLPRAPQPLPAAGNTVVALRMIAGLLEQQVFAPLPWRTTQGLVGGQEDAVAGWYRAFLQAGDRPLDARDHARLSELVLLHPAADELPALELPSMGHAWGFDLASGECLVVRHGHAHRLGTALTMYEHAGRSMPALLARCVAEAEGVP
jgi:hypothetical protein